MQQTTEDYVKTIYRLSKGGGVRGVELAEELGVSRATVSIHVKQLIGEGYLYMNRSHEIFLTEQGEVLALAVLERHRIISKFLVSLGVNEATAAADACKIEHAISNESFTALKRGIFEKEGQHL